MRSILTILLLIFFITNTYSDCTKLNNDELNQLVKENIQKEYRKVMIGMIYTESSGRPCVIGDSGASIGLLQLNESVIRGLYRQGVLTTYNEVNISLDEALRLRNNPEYNLYVSEILFKQNLSILRRINNIHKLNLDNKALLDLAVMSHNAGVTKIVRRRLLNKERPNIDVDKYLRLVKRYSDRFYKED